MGAGPGGYGAGVGRHDALIAAEIEDAGGYVFKTVGDAFCAVFAEAAAGVLAAAAAQRVLAAEAWPATPIRVRMALHSGVCEERANDYFGPTVNRVARLLSIGHGGQTLISGSTAALLADGLPDGMALRILGVHRLKDLARAERVFQLDGDGLPTSFPPLKSVDDVPRHNLPEQLTSFVGREREMEEITNLIASSRLVTLTGPGGIGKTGSPWRPPSSSVARGATGCGSSSWHRSRNLRAWRCRSARSCRSASRPAVYGSTLSPRRSLIVTC